MWVVTQLPGMFMPAIGATPDGGLVVGHLVSVAIVSANKIPSPDGGAAPAASFGILRMPIEVRQLSTSDQSGVLVVAPISLFPPVRQCLTTC
jgi:hypothetical protein